MLSHLAASFPPLSLVLDVVQGNQYRLPSQGLWNIGRESSGGGLVDAETWELKETFAGKISGLKHRIPTWLNATYAPKCLNSLLTWVLHETWDLMLGSAPYYVLNTQPMQGHSVDTYDKH